MPSLSRLFRIKDSNAPNNPPKKAQNPPVVKEPVPAKPSWSDAWLRNDIAPDEVHHLLRGCTQELKARALDTPFLLLPFRPSSDPSAARAFVRNYFNNSFAKGSPIAGDDLVQELRLTDPMVLSSVMKWCWSRLPGGVVSWEAYELFKVGEQDSNFARDAFSTFIPISVDSDARSSIIFDFFDLLAAIAAHGKSNGLGGRKLSRYAGWWAFEHIDSANGFDAAYNKWATAADATSHLFFAYLRSLSPDLPRGLSGISTLPIALQNLVKATEYPPETPSLLKVSTTRVVMIVDSVSATPFALLRRAKNFEYRDSDDHLQEFANFDDPLSALTDECFRVLRCISSSNESDASSAQTSTSLRDASWSRFEDIGFGGAIETGLDSGKPTISGVSSLPHSSGGEFNRPTTPSWADFMSTGFSEESAKANSGPLLLPPDKVLPPIATDRGQSSQSNRQTLDGESTAEPGELASINNLDLDDSFWWVWITSLAGEEPAPRKAVFGRCALIETAIKNAKWLVFEEQVKGAAPEPEQGAYVVEKKRRFGFGSRRGKLTRRKSSTKKMPSMREEPRRASQPQSKTNIAPDQHARIQAAAAALQKKHQEQEANGSEFDARGDTYSTKTNSVLTLQPSVMTEASQAMKWTTAYDKDAYRKAYLGDTSAGTGNPSTLMRLPSHDKPASPSSPSMTTKQAPVSTPKEQTEIKDPEPKSASAPEAAPESLEPVEPVEPVGPIEPTPEPVEPELKKSVSPEDKKSSSPEDSTKKLRKKPGATGFKSMFGTGRKKENKQQPPMKPTGAEPSAVAAARAALEGKAKAAQEQSRPTTNGSSVLKKKSVVEPEPEPEPEPESESRLQSQPEQSQSPPIEQKPATPETTETLEKADDNPIEKIPTQGPPSGVPKAYRDSDMDAISSVDTNERAAADAEFSRFDEGPLDQPAFVPEDSPISETPDKAPSPDNATSSVPAETEPEKSSPEPNSSHDRWAQIRKNAADRVAAGERPGHRSTDTERTDEGDTSGEENIESRVARIKARVAELTGNMEADH